MTIRETIKNLASIARHISKFEFFEIRLSYDNRRYACILMYSRQKSIRALEIFRVQKLILNATS